MAQLRSRLPRRIGSTGFIWRKQIVSTSTPADALLLNGTALTLNGSPLTLD